MTTQFSQFGLNPKLVQAVTERGFSAPTPIQAKAIPAVMARKDVMGLAQTGTGKTAAFMLPILDRLNGGLPGRIRALVLAPTRELAEQIRQETLDYARGLNLRTITIYGGVSKGPQISALRKGAEIVIACPGRLLDLMGEGRVDLKYVEVFVLDEADRMCDMGFLPDVRRIVAKLPVKRQTLFFSATMPADARLLAQSILKDPLTVQAGNLVPVETVSHALYPVPQTQKKDLLLALLERTATGRVLIFTRTKHRARNLARDLEKSGYRVSALQGNMSQPQRQRSIDGFRHGKVDFLVATDIAARGIDVSEISHVINFDMPDTVDAYTHRIGRTGRAEQSGLAFTLTSEGDEALVRDVEKTLGKRIERRQVEGFAYAGFSKENSAVHKAPAGAGRQATRPKAVANGYAAMNGRTYRPNRSNAQRSAGSAKGRTNRR